MHKAGFLLRKMLGTQYGPVGTRFSLILGTRIGSLKHLKKNWHTVWI